MQVGVSIPSTVPAWNSMRSIQRITVLNTLASQRRVLRVLYPPGNDTVLDITVAAAAGANASMLQHPNLGLNVTVNGVGLSVLIPVAGGQPAADRLDSLLQDALRLPAIDVGVELLGTESGGSVTFRVAVPRARVSVWLLPCACRTTQVQAALCSDMWLGHILSAACVGLIKEAT